MSVPIEALCQPISEELPSGENLEYDPEYMEMQSAFEVQGTGSVEVEGEEDEGPDWKTVQSKAASLLERTRDLKVQVYACLSSLHTSGLSEFRDNLKVLHCYVGEFWDSVHPQLDPDDYNDPMQRQNTIQMLNEYNLINKAVDSVKLVELKGMGQFGLREIELSKGNETPKEGEEVVDLNIIREAFSQAGGEYVDGLIEATDESLVLLDDIDNAWKERAEDPVGLSFDVAKTALKTVSGILFEFAPADSTAVAEESGEEVGADGDAAPAKAISGEVNSRADVIRMIDKICDYYDRNEPSSPMPMLLRRAQRLVDKSFLEILEDMVPDGVSQAKVMGGIEDDGY